MIATPATSMRVATKCIAGSRAWLPDDMLLLLFRIQPPIVLSEFRSSQHAFDGFAGAQDADDAAMIRHAGALTF
jgi:hypothetical protein